MVLKDSITKIPTDRLLSPFDFEDDKKGGEMRTTSRDATLYPRHHLDRPRLADRGLHPPDQFFEAVEVALRDQVDTN